MIRGLAVVLALAFALSGCSGCDLERMIEQPRFTYYEECSICPEGTIMMQPPEGTVSRSASLGPRELEQGRTASGAWVTQIPMPISKGVLARGKNRFDIFCAACHGPQGKGDGPTGRALIPPATDFTSQSSKKKSGAELRRIIEQGSPRTAMPAWKGQLSDMQLSDVAAYVETLRK